MSSDNKKNTDTGVAGVPNKTKVIKIEGNTLPQGNVGINTETGGQVPNPNTPHQQLQGNQQIPPKQSGGGPEGPAVQDNKSLAQSVQPNTTGVVQPPSDPNDINIDEFIASGTGEIKTGQRERIRKEKEDRISYKSNQF